MTTHYSDGVPLAFVVPLDFISDLNCPGIPHASAADHSTPANQKRFWRDPVKRAGINL
jgi:hypothetical protein